LDAGQCTAHLDVAAAAEAKEQAKRLRGNALFVERRPPAAQDASQAAWELRGSTSMRVSATYPPHLEFEQRALVRDPARPHRAKRAVIFP